LSNWVITADKDMYSNDNHTGALTYLFTGRSCAPVLAFYQTASVMAAATVAKACQQVLQCNYARQATTPHGRLSPVNKH